MAKLLFTLCSNPQGTLSVMPGKVFVQMYSNLEWETKLVEEQSVGEWQVLGEEKEEWKRGKIGNALPLQHKFKLTVKCKLNLIITVQYNENLHSDDCLFWFLPAFVIFRAFEVKDPRRSGWYHML